MAAPVNLEVPDFGRADLTNCERELIHLAGSVQPHGALLVLRETDLTVVQASGNAAAAAGQRAGAARRPPAGRPRWRCRRTRGASARDDRPGRARGIAVQPDRRHAHAPELRRRPAPPRGGRSGARARAERSAGARHPGRRRTGLAATAGGAVVGGAALRRRADRGPARRRRGPGLPRADRLRPRHGLQVRSRRPRQGHRRGAPPAAGVAARPPLPGHGHPATCARAVPAQPRAHAGQRRRCPVRTRTAPADRDEGAAGHVAVRPAQHVADPPSVPAQHGRDGHADRIAGARRPPLGPGGCPPLLAALPALRPARGRRPAGRGGIDAHRRDRELRACPGRADGAAA